MAIGAEGTRCFSCASTAYLSLWNQLMHHYFPPKNFTERCWQPDTDVGVVPCTSACFTLVEQVYEHLIISCRNVCTIVRSLLHTREYT
ncbi:hypothetical protein Tcan_07293 [Toxocara canis]|uniref:Uncharacterized protein n=1 Tax=Toxocara canis TaxID=6265 RepID=A0A0B2W3H8_TOXCA|nr:hypothetical protein Tcan_07293 [Toxocara canis]